MRFTYRAILGFIVFFLTLVATLFALGKIGETWGYEPPDFEEESFERVWTVTTLVLEKTDVTPQINRFGTIVAKNVTTIRAAANGVMQSKKPGLQNGDFVSAGETLFELDPFSFETAVAEAEVALATVENDRQRLKIELRNVLAQIGSAELQQQLANQNFERRQTLQARNVVASSAVEAAQRDLSVADATLQVRQLAVETVQNQLTAQDLTIAGARLALARAKKALDDASIETPQSGIISELNFSVDAPVGISEPLVTVTDPTTYQVKFQLTDAQYAQLLNDSIGLSGRPVLVGWQAGNQLVPFEASIQQISPSVEKSNGGIEVLADLHGLDPQTPLRQGTFVSVQLQEAPITGIHLLPSKAVSENGDVFVIEDGKLEDVDGEILGRFNNQLIVDLPLAAGTEIVANRYAQLAPGVPVSIFDPNRENPTDDQDKATVELVQKNASSTERGE